MALDGAARERRMTIQRGDCVIGYRLQPPPKKDAKGSESKTRNWTVKVRHKQNYLTRSLHPRKSHPVNYLMRRV